MDSTLSHVKGMHAHDEQHNVPSTHFPIRNGYHCTTALHQRIKAECRCSADTHLYFWRNRTMLMRVTLDTGLLEVAADIPVVNDLPNGPSWALHITPGASTLYYQHCSEWDQIMVVQLETGEYSELQMPYHASDNNRGFAYAQLSACTGDGKVVLVCGYGDGTGDQVMLLDPSGPWDRWAEVSGRWRP